MSSVDTRIVKMVFDNADFIKNISSTIQSITQLNKATDQMASNSGGGLSAMGQAFEQAEIMSTRAGFHIQDVWLKVASILEYQVAGKIVKIGKDIANAMTFEGVSDGFKEYELKMGSVQTIMAGTGESLQTVNKYLEELNTYSDKTIYSFADMTNNIGKFTNAGVKLEDAVGAIKGIANEAARSGANANEASRAMYNFSQALSAGYVKLIDWKSIENANMATKEFKDTLLEVASAVGTVEKGEDGMYKVLSKNANGATMKETLSATKNFNDSLAYQWMTTDVLTKTMNIYATDVRDMTAAEKEAYENELRSMGMSDEQIKRFEELGSAATDAASEVKTFSMLIDTLKEAIGSGWAQTWELIIGDFEEAKALWTSVSNVLGGIIDDQSKARNELLKGWDKLGGRKDLIEALGNAFKFVMNIARPVGQALREVFPPTTAKQLSNITKGILNFTKQLQFSSVVAAKIKNAAKGFFSIFDIALKFVKAFVKAILPAGSGLKDLGGDLLTVASNLGQFISNLDETITKSQTFEKVFQKISDVVKPIFSFLKSGAKGLLTILSDLFSSFKEAAGPMANVGDIFKRVFEDISGGITNIKNKIDKLSPIFEGFRTLLKGIGTFLGTIFRQIGDSISGVSFGGNGIGGLMNIFNAIMSGGIMFSIFNGIKSFSKIGESFAGILDNISDAIGNFGKKCGESDTLLNAAKAIAILAGSLFLIAMIDSNKLVGATTAITTLMFGLAAAIGILMKAINSFSPTDVQKSFKIFGKELFGSNVTQILEMSVTLGAVAKALLAMGGAVLMMSVGLKIISTAAEGGHLWDSFAVISLMLAELTGIAILLGKFGPKKATEGAKNLKGMGTALVLLAAALKIVSSVVAEGTAWEGLAIISIMLAELTGIVILLDKFTGYKMSSMLPLISMAVSLNLVVIALKSVSDALGNEGNHIWESLGVISIMLAELAGVCVVMSQFGGLAAIGGLGAIMAAAALLILVQALKQISDALGKTDQHIWQALGVIGASLVVLAVGLTLMAASIPGAAALLIASAGLVILAGALKIIGTLSLAEIGKGLLAMAGSLIILAVGLTAMILALPGALALVVASVGLTMLAGALKLFGSMKLGEIVKALLTLVVALTGIAVIGTVLSITAPFLLIFSVALLAFSAALIATGTAMTLFSAGLQAFVAVMPMLGQAITVLGTALLGLIPILAGALVDAIVVVATKIVEYAPVLITAIIAIIDMILVAIEASTVKIGQTIYNVILGVMAIITENIPLVAQAGADMMIAFMEAISTEIPRIVDAGYKCAIALINGLADAIENNNGDLIAAVDHLMNAVIQAITQWLVEFTPLGLLIPDSMKEGIMSGEVNVKDAVDGVIKNAIDGIKDNVEDFKEAAKDFIGGFIAGLEDVPLIGGVVKAAANLGAKAVEALRSKKGVDAHSDSRKTIPVGEDTGGGFITGMENTIPGVEDAASLLGDTAIGSITGSITDGIPELDGAVGDISNTITNGFSETLKSATGINQDYSKSLERSRENLEKLDKQTHMSVKGEQELQTEGLRSEKIKQKQTEAIKKHEDATLKDVKAMKTSHDQAATLHERNEQLKNGELTLTHATKSNTEATEANTQAQEANATATGKSGTAAKKTANVMEYGKGVVEAFTKQYGHLYSQLGDDGPAKVAALAVKKLAEETYKASLKTKNATEVNEKTKVSIEDMIKTFTEMRSKIYDSVKSVFEGDNFFQKFEVKTSTSMQSLLENMRSNINGVTDWANKLKVLGDKGVDQGLLKHLAELGPKSNEYVNAFSTATAEQIQEANQLFAQSATLPDSIADSTLASYAKAGLNVVEGFANGIDENTKLALDSIKSLDTTTYTELTDFWKIASPSKKTYDDGMWLIMGLASGINNFTYLAHNAAVNLTTNVTKVISENLAKSKFYDMGKNVAYGLAEGMSDDKAKKSVTNAATALSEIASSVTTKYNEIESPSKLYKRFGGYIAQGFGSGMSNGVSYVEKGAMALSEAIHNTIQTAEEIAQDDMQISPVITPVLDLTNVRKNANSIGSLFPGRSIAMASSIGIGRSQSSTTSSSDSQNPATTQVNFTQNNYSPKALNRIDIYRQTKNQVSMMKGALA